ncbi:MAG: hypothetical protein KGJ55_06170 [Gammaproteobacteria bacterium]|nr:hypothetical protein [Gammaproteobacteria bacterium]
MIEFGCRPQFPPPIRVLTVQGDYHTECSGSARLSGWWPFLNPSAELLNGSERRPNERGQTMNCARRPPGGHRPARVLIILSLTFFAAACGSGNNSTPSASPPPTAQGTTITGSVLAPNGTLARLEQPSLFKRLLASFIPSARAQTAGLAPVAGTNVLVFAIDDAGKPTGGVIASTTTAADGSFSLTLPAGTTLASNLIVQASGATTPQPVGPANQNTQSCPLGRANLPPITPATEYATRALISEIQSKAGTLGNFTVDEVNAIIQQAINLLNSNPNLVGGTIEDTINNLIAADDPQIRQLIDDTSPAGEGSAPQGLGGTYNVIGFEARTASFFERRGQEIGTVTLDLSAKTFALNTTQNRAELNETCSGSAPCDRAFVRSFNSSSNSSSGAITVLSGNLISFQTSDGGVLGSFNSTGDIIVIPDEESLILAIKQTGAAPALGGTYQGGELDSSLNSSFTVAADSPYSVGDSRTALDSIVISGGSLTGAANESTMGKDITCSGAGTCPDAETLTALGQSNPIGASVAVSGTGVLTVTPAGGSALTGAVTGNGGLFALAAGDPNTGDAGVVLGVKQGSNMTNASASGTYNVAGFELDLNSGSTSVRSQGGTITLDGNGNANGNLATLEKRVTTGCVSGSLCPSESDSEGGTNDAISASYSVSPTGAVTVTPAGGTDTIQGFASQDGGVIVLTSRRDGTIGTQNGSSHRDLFVLIK